MSDNTGAKYKILNGIKIIRIGIPSVFKLLNPVVGKGILMSSNNKIIICTGKFNKSNAVAVPKSEMVQPNTFYKFNSTKFLDNIVIYLTNGICTDYRKCLRAVEDYKKYIGMKNQVLVVKCGSKFNLVELVNQIILNEWHVLVGCTFWSTRVTTDAQGLLNHYGICATRKSGFTDWNNKENICKDYDVIP